MEEFTVEENAYITESLKSIKRSYRIMGAVILAAAVLAGIPVIRGLDSFSPGSGTGLILNLAMICLFFLGGLAFFVSSFLEEHSGRRETLSGRYRVRVHRRRYHCEIGKQRVIIPSAWHGWFQRGEEYAVEVFVCRIGFFRPVPLTIKVQGLPESLAGIPLTEMKKSEKWLLSQVYRTYLFYGIVMVLPFLGIVGAVQVFSRNLDGVDRFLEQHSESIIGFFSYLSDHDSLMGLFQFFFRYGFIIFMVVLILAVTLIRSRVPGGRRSGGGNYQEESGKSLDWRQWISRYADFSENRLKPVMLAASNHDPSLLTEYREVMNQLGTFQREYKQYKKSLNGAERAEFLLEFKRITKKGR